MADEFEAPEWICGYERALPGFTRQLRRTIHVPPGHPMYRDYYQYAFWRFEQGRSLCERLGELRPLKSALVLDIGSGCGGVSARFSEAGAGVVGLDVAWGFLRLARAAYRDLGIEPWSLFASGERIPLRSGSCDIILALDLLEHVPDPQALFDEIARCLKPDGLVCLQTGYRYEWKNIRRDPHYGLPLVILLPRWLRELIVVRLARRNPELEDYYWFKSYREVFECFARRGLVLHRDGDVLIGGRLRRSEVVLGAEGDWMHLDGDPGQEAGFYGAEEHGATPMRWSRRRAVIRLRREPQHRQLRLRLAALDPRLRSRPQRVAVRVEGGRRRSLTLYDHGWKEWTLPLPAPRTELQRWLCSIELRVRPTWRPLELGIPDARELGVAVHSAALR